jgi:hypothetical protein
MFYLQQNWRRGRTGSAWKWGAEGANNKINKGK